MVFRRKYRPREITTIALIDKAKTIIGQKCRIQGCCGDFENVTLIDLIDVRFRDRIDGHREVCFSTDDSFYSSAWWDEETIMNWKYNKE
jgi:hypothetical protein